MKHSFLRTMLLPVLFTTGCYVGEPVQQYPGEEDGGADLVEVSPGVEVIADYDEPIFFADDFYWVNRGGYWWSSRWYGGGWGRADHVPDHIRGISHPETFRHYRPAGFTAHEHIRGYAQHQQYHATHAASGGARMRAAPHGGGGGHHR
jgi:hypothetical protein